MRDTLLGLTTVASDSAALLLLDTVIKATILLGVASLVTALLWRASAAVRHRVWCLAFAGLLMLPVLSLLLPGWRVPIFPQVLHAKVSPTITPVADNTFGETGSAAVDASEFRMQQATLDEAADDYDQLLLTAETHADTERAKQVDVSPVEHVIVNSEDETTSSVSWSVLPVFVWLVGVGVCMLPLALSPLRTRRLTRSAREINDPQPSGLLRELCRSLDIRRRVRLLETDRSLVPMTWGVLRPVMLFPCTWRDWSEQRRRFVLLHELAHVKRCDVALQMLARGACAMYWFHPLAWFALRRLRIERELACDDCVLMAGQCASDYAQQLVEIARTHHLPSMPNAVAMASSKRLESRVRAVLDRARSRMPLSRSVARLFLVFAVITVTGLAVVQPAAWSDPQEEANGNAAEATASSQDVDEAAPESRRLDLYGDPLPAGAIVRLGTKRLRHEGCDKRIWILPDNKTVVSAAERDGQPGNGVLIWDAETGKLQQILDYGDRTFKVGGLNNDGTTFITFALRPNSEQRKSDCELRAWDTSTWKVRSVARWQNPWSSDPDCLAVTPDGKIIAIGNNYGKIYFRSVISGQKLSISTAKNLRTESLAFSPDGSLLAAATQNGVFLWDWRSEKEPKELAGKLERANAVCFSPDGKLLAIGSIDKVVQIWDVESQQKLQQLKSNKQNYGRQDLAFSCDGKLLAVPANRSGNSKPTKSSTIDLFDVSTGKLLRSLDTGSWGPGDVAISGDGKLLASVGLWATIKLWKMPEGKSLSDRFVGHDKVSYEMQFTLDGKNIVTGSMDGTVRIWDADTGRQVHELRHKRWISGLDVSSDGCRVLSCGLDNTLRLWKFASGKQLHKLKGHGITGGNRNHSLGFTPDGKRFLSIGNDLNLRTFDADDGHMLAEHAIRPGGIKIEETGNPLFPIKIVGPTDPFSAEVSDVIKRVRLTADRTRLLLSAGSVIYVFDTASGRELDKFETEDSLDDFILTPDQKLLLTKETRRSRFRFASEGKRTLNRFHYFIRIHDFATKKMIRQISTQRTHARIRTVSADSTRLAVCMNIGGSVHPRKRWLSVFDLRTGQECNHIEGITSRPTQLAFSADGRRLACGLSDSTVVVWDLDKFVVSSPEDAKDTRPPATGGLDVQARIDAAVQRALKAGKHVLIVYGSDEQKACRDLLKLSETNRDLGRFVGNEFETVLIDVDLSKPVTGSMPTFGTDLKQAGLPYLVVLAADGKVLTKGRAIEPTSGAGWDAERLKAFLKKWAVATLDARKLLEDAQEQAKKEGKAVLISICTPWCIPCHRLADFLQQHKNIFEQDYVMLGIDVERMTSGKEVAAQVGGNPHSVPWMVIVDAEGKLLSSSGNPNGNIGFPNTPEEIEYFLTMITKTSKRIAPKQLEQIRKDLSNQD